MNIPQLDNQNFSETTLKGFLLKNLDLKTKHPVVQQVNACLVKRVDDFWNTVVVKLQKEEKFDGNKINWYFEVYKEGIDAHKLKEHPFPFFQVQDETIEEIVAFYKDKTLEQYVELGTSFLSNSYSLLSSYLRDKTVLQRLEHIYGSLDPYDWIVTAEKEDRGVMSQQPDINPVVLDLIKNIGLIMSKRL